MDKKKKLNLYKGLGVTLIKKGQWFLEVAFSLTKTPLAKSLIAVAVYDAFGGTFDKKLISMQDSKYLSTSWDTWKDLIEYDWIDKREYIAEYFDCDNFADNFCSHINEIYGMNTAGRLSVELLNPETKEHIDYHRAVIIVDKDYNVYLLESQNDKWVKIEGKNPIIGTWEYKPTVIEFN